MKKLDKNCYVVLKMYEARKNAQGGQAGNTNAVKNEADKMSSPFKTKREVRDGTAGQITKKD